MLKRYQGNVKAISKYINATSRPHQRSYRQRYQGNVNDTSHKSLRASAHSARHRENDMTKQWTASRVYAWEVEQALPQSGSANRSPDHRPGPETDVSKKRRIEYRARARPAVARLDSGCLLYRLEND